MHFITLIISLGLCVGVDWIKKMNVVLIRSYF